MIFIGIPNTGTLRTELVSWLLKQKAVIFMPQNRPIDYNRNVIVREFLNTDCDWLLMVDSDVVPVTDVLLMANNNVAVCSAHVCTYVKGERIPVGMTKNNKGYHHNFKHSRPGLHKVDVVGTGCVMIRRDVFKKLNKPYFRFIYDKDGMLLNGEDFNFSERVGDVYFDSRQKCLHYTTVAI